MNEDPKDKLIRQYQEDIKVGENVVAQFMPPSPSPDNWKYFIGAMKVAFIIMIQFVLIDCSYTVC